MTITPNAVRLAMQAVTAAPPWQRRARMRDLMAAGTEMTALVSRYHAWLVAEDAWLLERFGNPEFANDPEYWKREARYLARLPVYMEAHTVLGEALLVIGQEEPKGVMVKAANVETFVAALAANAGEKTS